ncbi:MAG: DUF1549 and DUF1553 domain-containing protein [Verrucomicrobiota bacterium]|nr:DUF1549 and DUF1553 domain-containing protein [Verrucomicrobiota bacterium]
MPQYLTILVLLFLLLGKGLCLAEVASQESWWALKPLKQTKIPVGTSAPTSWQKHPIDSFVAAKHAEIKLTPSPTVDRRTFIRRATFDLIGLPPTPEEVETYLANKSPEAPKQLIEKLLSSPKYGERWARHWMDVAHYAETHGHDEDAIRENAWPYRDYLINSFNSDKPYDQFVREQIAGDILFPENPASTAAIGFLATGPWDESSQMGISDGTIDKKIAQYLDRDDMIATVMSTFLSTTVHCARCHDHKFDPISIEDYYSLQAVFAGVDKVDRPYDDNAELADKRKQLLSRKRKLEKKLIPNDIFLKNELAEIETALLRVEKRWKILSSPSVSSSNGNIFKARPDGSFLSIGPAPQKDIVTFRSELDVEEVTAFQLDVLTDKSLPKGGPGHAINGNLHLSEVVVKVNGKPIKIAKAVADFSQNDWLISHAIDQNTDTAWGIHPLEGKPHRAVFIFEKPIRESKGKIIVIELHQLHGRNHLIGRPRISLTNISNPILEKILPLEISRLLKIKIADRTKDESKTLALYFAKDKNDRQLAMLGKQKKVYAVASHFAANGNFKPSQKPRLVHVLNRGSIHSPVKEAQPGALQCISGLSGRLDIKQPDIEGERRAALAHWITDRQNSLLWRSIVNRVWHYHFGQGIVGTPNDFGRMGDLPTHPELLDWLAFEFRANGGSLKWLHRTIMTSSTYRQQSTHRLDFAHRDADNKWLWRMNRKRLDAESYRDAVLQIGGNMDWRMGGPSDRQFNMSKGVHVTPNLDYIGFDPNASANNRRSVYRFIFRTIPDPLMQLMDCPDASQHAPKRDSSLTALQALGMLNNRFLVRQSERLADRLKKESPILKNQVIRLFKLTYHRKPNRNESRLVAKLARDHGLANACRVILNSNEFLFVN